MATNPTPTPIDAPTWAAQRLCAEAQRFQSAVGRYGPTLAEHLVHKVEALERRCGPLDRLTDLRDLGVVNEDELRALAAVCEAGEAASGAYGRVPQIQLVQRAGSVVPMRGPGGAPLPYDEEDDDPAWQPVTDPEHVRVLEDVRAATNAYLGELRRLLPSVKAISELLALDVKEAVDRDNVDGTPAVILRVVGELLEGGE